MVALCYNKQAVDKRWSSGVVVNMPPCHGGDRGFESHLDRQLIEMFRCGTFFMGLFHCMPNFLWDLRKEWDLLLHFLWKLFRIMAYRDVAQLGSALRSGRRGRRFKSCHPDQLFQIARHVRFFIVEESGCLYDRLMKKSGNTFVDRL